MSMPPAEHPGRSWPPAKRRPATASLLKFRCYQGSVPWWRYLLFEGLAAHLHGEAEVNQADGAALAGQLHVGIVYDLLEVVDHAVNHRRGREVAAAS